MKKLRSNKICKTGFLKLTLNVLEDKCYENGWEEATYLLSKIIEFSPTLMRIKIENKFVLSRRLALMLKNLNGNTQMKNNLFEIIPRIMDLDKYFFSDKVSPEAIFRKNGGVECLINL